MSAAYETGVPGFVQRRHLPPKPTIELHHDVTLARCKHCNKRKPRKGGIINSRGFYCEKCK